MGAGDVGECVVQRGGRAAAAELDDAELDELTGAELDGAELDGPVDGLDAALLALPALSEVCVAPCRWWPTRTPEHGDHGQDKQNTHSRHP